MAEVAGDIKCTTDKVENSPQMDAKATDFVIKILTEYDLLQLSKAPDCFVNNARYILSKIYNLTHSIFKNFIINLLFQTFSSF